MGDEMTESPFAFGQLRLNANSGAMPSSALEQGKTVFSLAFR
jgi:hypothetical protein